MKYDLPLESLPWEAPYLTKPADEDLSKQWCITYKVFSFDKYELVRKRIILAQPTAEERHQQAEAIIREITDYLKDGRAYVGKKPKDWKPAPTLITTPVMGPDPTKVLLVIANASTDYLEFVSLTHGYNTFKTYRSSVFHLLAFLERHGRRNETFLRFEPEDAVIFLKELITVSKLSNRTRNNIMGHVITFFNHYIYQDKRLRKKGNPFDKIGKLPQVSHKHQSYSLLQQDAYRTTALELGLDDLLFFCRWMYYTLMRPHEELRRLRVRDIRINTIYVSGHNAKDNDGEFIDIPRPLELLIQQKKIRDYPGHYYVFSTGGEPGPTLLGNKYFYRRHVKVLTKINLTDSGHDMYSWKHTGAIALWTATKDIELIRNQARHSDIAQTIEYLRDLGVRMADDDKIHRFPVF